MFTWVLNISPPLDIIFHKQLPKGVLKCKPSKKVLKNSKENSLLRSSF